MIIILLLALVGLGDSMYLTVEHFNKVIPPCVVHPFIPAFLIDCGKVLTSPYSSMFGIPLAVMGLGHYGVLSLLIAAAIVSKNKFFKYLVILQSAVGAVSSFYFMYVQIGIIGSLCLYCTLSAMVSFVIFALTYNVLRKERFEMHLAVYAFVYQNIIKRIFFLFDPEFIHTVMVNRGKLLARTPLIKFMGSKLIYEDKSLRQRIAGIHFENPVGLAAGFDYNADLTQTLYYLDFGFQTVGTLTAFPYEGNPRPRMGRLLRSRSLMVNKGFKNKGAEAIAEKLSRHRFMIPLGVSLGMSNTDKIKSLNEGIRDIISAFRTFEKYKVTNSYYELNVSCPNLIHAAKINFYSPKNLRLLLLAVDRLKLKKPVFVKMPIDKSNREVMTMLKEIAKHRSVKGVIIGNLMKDRKNKALVASEVRKFKVGNFSGKACEDRSNELIRTAYRKYKGRLIIVGCGGVFNGMDAYKKIRLGASLIQLITGMIFQGPQVISQINLELIDLIAKDGFKHVSLAVGVDNN